jgi:two-component system NtrC family sensor kinase
MAGETVLIIDDSIAIASLLANEILPHAGYRTAVSLSGREGLEAAQRTSPDLILCDLEMPDMNGLEVLRSLRGSGHDIPAVMMTAFGSEAIAAQALRIGVKDYIIKPFTTEEILAAVDNALGESRLRKKLEDLTVALKEQERTLSILRALSYTASSGLESKDLLSRIVLAAVYSQGAEGGFLAQVDQSGHLAISAAIRFPQLEGKRLPITDDSPLSRALRTPQITQSRDRGGYWYYAPLMRRDRALGLLAIYTREGRSVANLGSLFSILAAFGVCMIANRGK